MKSGKSTLAEELVDLFGYTRVSFARPLKEGCRMLGMDVDDFSPTKDVKGLQDIGAYFRDNYGADYWVRLLEKRIAHQLADGAPLVIDDLRFLNEAEWCRDHGFILIRLDVRRETQLARGADPTLLDKVSETALDEWPHFDVFSPEADSVQQRVKSCFDAAAFYDEICGVY